MIFSVQREPYIKRLPTVIDRVYGIQAYDVDNLYPQRADEVRKRSFTLKSAVDVIADFIKGQGFEDVTLANLILNSDGHTANDVLDFLSQEKSPYVGVALHFKYNPFSFKIMEVTPLEWSYCRLGLPDQRGNVSEIMYCTNWEQDPNKMLNNVMQIDSYPTFNPDPNIVKEQIAEHGWDCYPGQIWYWTPKPGKYPGARFDAVFDDAQTQSDIGVAKLSGIQNKFAAQHIFHHPGKFETPQKKQDFKDEMSDMMGAKGTNSMLVIEDDGAANGAGKLDLVESIQMQNTDKMYEFTSKDTRNAIRESMAVPAPLLGQLPEGGMFNKEQMLEAYEYMNMKTQGDRDQLERIFKRIFMFWHQAITVASFKIKPMMYGIAASQTAVTPGQTNQPGQTAQPGAAPAAERKVDASLSKLSAGEQANLERIIRKVNKGKMTRDAGITLLKMTYGFTDDEVKAFIP